MLYLLIDIWLSHRCSKNIKGHTCRDLSCAMVEYICVYVYMHIYVYEENVKEKTQTRHHQLISCVCASDTLGYQEFRESVNIIYKAINPTHDRSSCLCAGHTDSWRWTLTCWPHIHTTPMATSVITPPSHIFASLSLTLHIGCWRPFKLSYNFLKHEGIRVIQMIWERNLPHKIDENAKNFWVNSISTDD